MHIARPGHCWYAFSWLTDGDVSCSPSFMLFDLSRAKEVTTETFTSPNCSNTNSVCCVRLFITVCQARATITYHCLGCQVGESEWESWCVLCFWRISYSILQPVTSQVYCTLWLFQDTVCNYSWPLLNVVGKYLPLLLYDTSFTIDWRSPRMMRQRKYCAYLLSDHLMSRLVTSQLLISHTDQNLPPFLQAFKPYNPP